MDYNNVLKDQKLAFVFNGIAMCGIAREKLDGDVRVELLHGNVLTGSMKWVDPVYLYPIEEGQLPELKEKSERKETSSLWTDLLRAYKEQLGTTLDEVEAMRLACSSVGVIRRLNFPINPYAGTVKRIIAHVCYHLGLSENMLRASSRYGSLVMARSFVVWIARAFKIPYREIGESLGRRDHSTMVTCIHRIEKSSTWITMANELLRTFKDEGTSNTEITCKPAEVTDLNKFRDRERRVLIDAAIINRVAHLTQNNADDTDEKEPA